MSEELTSTAIMTSLIAAAPAQRKETLSRLKSACDDLEADGKFRLRDIERRVAVRFGKQFGPKAQTISNEKLFSLGMYHYVEARRREATTVAIRGSIANRQPKRVHLQARIEMIGDIDLRNVMRDMYDRLATTEAALSRAKHILRTTRPGADVDALLAGKPLAERALVDQAAIDALSRLRMILTNDEKLSSCGLVNLNGQIRRKGRLGDELIDERVLSSFLVFCSRLDAL